MKIIHAKEHAVLPLGRQTESNVAAVRFDYSEWRETYGTGSVVGYHRRPGDTDAHPVLLNADGENAVLWTVTSQELARAGKGQLQFFYIVSDGENTLRKASKCWITHISESVTSTEEPPEPYENWVESLMEIAENACDSVAAEIEGLTVSAETGSAGSEAGVEKTGGDGTPYNLHFRIPRGATGPQGEMPDMSAYRTSDEQDVKTMAVLDDAQPGYFSPVPGVNKYNKSTELPNSSLLPDGRLNPTTDYRTSDFISLKGNTSGYVLAYMDVIGLDITGTYCICFYDSDKSLISGENNTSSNLGAQSVPSGAEYARCCFEKNIYWSDNPMFVFGQTKKPYEAYSETQVRLPLELPDILSAASELPDSMKLKITESDIVENTIIVGSNGNAVTGSQFQNYVATEFLNISSHLTDVIRFHGYLLSVFGFAFYDKNKAYISGISGDTAEEHGYIDSDRWQDIEETIPTGAAYIRICASRTIYTSPDDFAMHLFVLPLHLLERSPDSPWKGKTWLSYGDSITDIGNAENADSWQKHVTEKLGFAAHYGRGIGGQYYKWGTGGGSVTFVNAATGAYDSRNDSYNKDNYTGSVPTGCVAIRGAFSSWDRISHMIPASIKDDIDLIFLFGVNDVYQNDSDDVPAFSATNTTDTEWMAADENEFGGDFDVTTLNGAIASTLMKLQARCPNALIVIGTSWSGRGETDGENQSNISANGIGIYKEGLVVEKVSGYYAIPCIDLHHTLMVNCWNRARYVTDTIHPYTDAGKKALARAVISGLMGMYPRFDV